MAEGLDRRDVLPKNNNKAIMIITRQKGPVNSIKKQKYI
tara:strand:- start:2 stop:118 length:117 start_codon:yes stop_codon:yes gene_type:complete